MNKKLGLVENCCYFSTYCILKYDLTSNYKAQKVLESSLKVHNYGVSTFIFPNLLHYEIYALPELHVFLEISLDKNFLVSQKGHYGLWVPSMDKIRQS